MPAASLQRRTLLAVATFGPFDDIDSLKRAITKADVAERFTDTEVIGCLFALARRNLVRVTMAGESHLRHVKITRYGLAEAGISHLPEPIIELGHDRGLYRANPDRTDYRSHHPTAEGGPVAVRHEPVPEPKPEEVPVMAVAAPRPALSVVPMSAPIARVAAPPVPETRVARMATPGIPRNYSVPKGARGGRSATPEERVASVSRTAMVALLREVNRHDPPATRRAIRQAFHQSGHTTYVIERARKDGLVTVAVDGASMGDAKVSITEAGRAYVEGAAGEVASMPVPIGRVAPESIASDTITSTRLPMPDVGRFPVLAALLERGRHADEVINLADGLDKAGLPDLALKALEAVDFSDLEHEVISFLKEQA